MTDENRKQNSLIHIGSTTLVRVGNSIELTNRIITKYAIRIVPFRVDQLWYIYNIDSKQIISDGFDLVKFIDNSFTDSKSLLIANGEDFSILNNPSELASLMWYKDLKPLTVDKMKMIVYLNGKCGLIDANGKTLIPISYDKIIDKLRFRNASSDEILIVSKNRKYGIIDLHSFKTILPIEYDLIEETGYVDSDNILKVKQDNKIGVFDCKSKSLLFLAEFVDIMWCNEGICSVKINSKWALFDFQLNQMVNKSEYDSTKLFTNGYAICYKINDGFYAVYKNGLEVKIDINSKPENTIMIHRYNDVFIAQEITTVWKQNGNVHSSESMHKFHIYVKLKFLSIIEYKQRARHCSVRMKNNIIEIIEAGKYGGYRTVKYFNLHGDEISEKDFVHLTNNHSALSGNTISITDKAKAIRSNWKIIDKQLFYKDELIYEHPYGELYADLTLDFPRLTAVIDVDPEFGVTEDLIGYIDQYGNVFWKDN